LILQSNRNINTEKVNTKLDIVKSRAHKYNSCFNYLFEYNVNILDRADSFAVCKSYKKSVNYI